MLRPSKQQGEKGERSQTAGRKEGRKKGRKEGLVVVAQRQAEDPSGRTRKGRRCRGSEGDSASGGGREEEEPRLSSGGVCIRADIDRGLRLRGKRRERKRAVVPREQRRPPRRKRKNPPVPRGQSIVASTRNGPPPPVRGRLPVFS